MASHTLSPCKLKQQTIYCFLRISFSFTPHRYSALTGQKHSPMFIPALYSIYFSPMCSCRLFRFFSLRCVTDVRLSLGLKTTTIKQNKNPNNNKTKTDTKGCPVYVA